MWRKVYFFYSSTFRRGHVKAEKTAPEPELEPEPEPDLKPEQQDDQEPEPDSEPEDEFDPIEMLTALPQTACGTTDRFNPQLSPILEVRSECTMSEDGVSQKSWIKWLTEQMLCNAAARSRSGHLEKSSSFEIKEKKQKLPLSMVCLFGPKCGTFSRPSNERVHSFPKRNNERADALLKPKRRLRSDITTAIRILKAKYRGGGARSQDKDKDKELSLTGKKKTKF